MFKLESCFSSHQGLLLFWVCESRRLSTVQVPNILKMCLFGLQGKISNCWFWSQWTYTTDALGSQQATSLCTFESEAEQKEKILFQIVLWSSFCGNRPCCTHCPSKLTRPLALSPLTLSFIHLGLVFVVVVAVVLCPFQILGISKCRIKLLYAVPTPWCWQGCAHKPSKLLAAAMNAWRRKCCCIGTWSQ